MRIKSLRALPGPSIYSYRPVLTAELDVDEAERSFAFDPAFIGRLKNRLGGVALEGVLPNAACCHPVADRATSAWGTSAWAGHATLRIVEEVVRHLHHRLGIATDRCVRRLTNDAALSRLAVEYQHQRLAEYLLQAAVGIVEQTAQGGEPSFEVWLDEARSILRDWELGPSTRSIVEAAQRRGIPWERLNEASLIQLGYGCRRRLIQAAETDRTSDIAVDIACDKVLTKSLLDRAYLPVPAGKIARTVDEAVLAFQELTPPVAVKPVDGNQGRGISLNLNTPSEVVEAFQLAHEISSKVIIEEMFVGKDYRVLVVGGKVVAASERVPAHVIGNGRDTIEQLIEQANADPARGEGHENSLTKIRVDELGAVYLRRIGRALADVPAEGERVFLRETANLSTGGTACDVTDEVHPDVAWICERAAAIIGLDICGIDLLLPDIAAPLPRIGSAGIVEVNAGPGLRMHLHPSQGEPRDVGAAIIDMLFPEQDRGRIPIVAVTGTNGKTTVTRLIGHALAQARLTVGMTSTDGVSIGGRPIATGDMTGYHSAKAVLTDPTVEVAVLETARGGILRRSLGYDWSDVAVLTNIQPDHLGRDGVETIDDLLEVKMLLAERVREGGTLVLNADDERLARLPAHPRIAAVDRRIVYFSLSHANPVLRAHAAAGGTAYFVRGGWLMKVAGGRVEEIAVDADFPITLGGMAEFQVANILAAIAACESLGVASQDAARALIDFDPDHDNPGRMNLFAVERGHVILDYGHNPAALEAICRLVSNVPRKRSTLVFTVPGDRPEELIRSCAELVARSFDRITIREDGDLRGRCPGEVARIIQAAAAEVSPNKECVYIPDESTALEHALEEMEEGDLVVFVFEDYREGACQVLERFGAKPVASIKPLAATTVNSDRLFQVEESHSD